MSLYQNALKKEPDNALLLNNYSYSLAQRDLELDNYRKDLEKMVDTIPQIEADLKNLDRDYAINKKNGLANIPLGTPIKSFTASFNLSILGGGIQSGILWLFVRTKKINGIIAIKRMIVA